MTEQEWGWTEQEWLTSSDPEVMLRGLDGLESQLEIRLSERKLRLFLVACLRRIMHVFRDERNRGLVAAVEPLADDLVTGEYLIRLEEQSHNPQTQDLPNPEGAGADDSPVARASDAYFYACQFPLGGFEAYCGAGHAREAADQPEAEQQAQLA